MNDYTHDYRLLGVPPNCSLQILKAARRRLVKSWHPDHFPSGTEMRRQAEERIKDINTAFERLLGYYKKFGILPAPSANVAARTSPIVTSSAPAKTKNVGATKRPAPARAADRPMWRVWHVAVTARWIVALAAVSLTVAVASVVVLKLEEQNTNSAAISSQIPSEPRGDPSSREPPAALATRQEYFTIGSPLGEVYAVQGVPTATTNGAWRYGKSTVYFTDGLVTLWEEDPANPLNATLLTRSTAHTAASFTFGSTKAEVRAVEGAPLFETSALWDYGLSKVYFRDDRVIGWESSPMHPLKARK